MKSGCDFQDERKGLEKKGKGTQWCDSVCFLRLCVWEELPDSHHAPLSDSDFIPPMKVRHEFIGTMNKVPAHDIIACLSELCALSTSALWEGWAGSWKRFIVLAPDLYRIEPL